MTIRTIPIKDCGKGVNFDLAPAELELGVCCGQSVNFRYRNGFAERFRGPSNTFTPSVTPYWMEIYATSTLRHLVYSGIAKAYAYSSVTNTSTEITRYTAGVVISSISSVLTVATVTTASAHGRSNGDIVTLYGSDIAEYSVTGAITVTGANTFTITITSFTGSATVVGYYSYNVTQNFTGAALNRITGGSLNGVLLVNNPIDGLFYWNGSLSTRLRPAPNSYVAKVTRPFKNYYVQLGPTIDGIKYPFDVVWSDAAEPGSLPGTVIAAATNSAGRVSIAQTNGEMVDCLPLGDANILYAKDSRWAMRFVGGSAVFSFERLVGNDGLLNSQCVVQTPKGHVFLTPELDVKIHTGGEATSLAQGRVLQYLRDAVFDLSGYYERMTLLVNPMKSEVWVCHDTSAVGSGSNRAVLAWNWESDTWSNFDVAVNPITCGARGQWEFSGGVTNLRDVMWIGTTTTRAGMFDDAGSPFYFDANVITAKMEFKGLHFDDRGRMKAITSSRWNVDTAPSPSNAILTIQHGSAMTSDATPTYATGATYTTGTTDKANSRSTQGRFGAVLMTSVSATVSVRSIDLEMEMGGTR